VTLQEDFNMAQNCISEVFTSYEASVGRCMAAGGAKSLFDDGRPVMLKPNLINASPHPVTTPPALCAAVIAFVRRHTDAPIVIAEGCGDASLETPDVFAQLGYEALAEDLDVGLLDLNRAPLKRLTDASCRIFPEMWLPCAVFEHVLISLPVLKAHSLCRLTGSMKNMMGLAPPEHYGGRFGSWKKAAFHQRLNAAIVALNRYRTPDFTVMDATVGLAEYHLGGPSCQPPVNRLLAGRDARALDREAARLLGMDWQAIGYLDDPEV
jgi:uncharacterized protein (DUF362 family)